MPDPLVVSRLFHRDLRDPPMTVRTGHGIYLVTDDGRTVIDGAGGAAVACLGHGHKRVTAAIAEQTDRVAYAHTGLFTTEAAEVLAEALVGPDTTASRAGLRHAFFVSSGSEASEAALKLARQYFLEIGEPARARVIARRGSYHGNTLGALAASGNVARRAPYEPLLSQAFSHVSPCYAYRGRRSEEDDAAYVSRLLAELSAAFDAAGPGTVMAFIAETVVGATLGCVPPVAGYLRGVRALCDEHGALLILDEVMCGLGRCGTTHAWEAEGVPPDIQVVAKGLGGGYQPIGGILVADRVASALRAGTGSFVHGHTYQAHPVACAAAVAVQQTIAEDGLVQRSAELGARLAAGLRERLGQHPHVGDIRGRGLFHAIELVADRETKMPLPPQRRAHAAIGRAALARGLAVYPMGGTVDGVAGDHVLLAPAFIASEAEIDMIVARFSDAVREVLR